MPTEEPIAPRRDPIIVPISAALLSASLPLLLLLEVGAEVVGEVDVEVAVSRENVVSACVCVAINVDAVATGSDSVDETNIADDVEPTRKSINKSSNSIPCRPMIFLSQKKKQCTISFLDKKEIKK